MAIVFSNGNRYVFGPDDIDPDSSQTENSFGYALAVGDFDGNQGDDLAIGIPQWSYLEAIYDHVGRIVVGYGIGPDLDGIIGGCDSGFFQLIH